MTDDFEYPRYELIHVTYDDGVALCYLHKIEMEYDYDDDDLDGVYPISQGEYLENVMSISHENVLKIFGEEFRWKMEKMSIEEYEEYRLKSFRYLLFPIN